MDIALLGVVAGLFAVSSWIYLNPERLRYEQYCCILADLYLCMSALSLAFAQRNRIFFFEVMSAVWGLNGAGFLVQAFMERWKIRRKKKIIR